MLKGVRTMKATLSINTRKAIEREVAKELERQRAVVYRQAAEDLMPQALAFFLWTMQLNYGWGENGFASWWTTCTKQIT